MNEEKGKLRIWDRAAMRLSNTIVNHPSLKDASQHFQPRLPPGCQAGMQSSPKIAATACFTNLSCRNNEQLTSYARQHDLLDS
jgi:hypothetical protein